MGSIGVLFVIVSLSMSKNIFLIGPASAGKSTAAKLLAEKLDYSFIDIDLVFCNRIALIPNYIQANSYTEYCERNSLLVDELLIENPTDTVFATPSGFLVHEDSPHLVQKHLKLVSQNAISVLLLPSKDPHDTVDLIVKRQKMRWPEVNRGDEGKRYIDRHRKYIEHGDIQIIGTQPPLETVDMILNKLRL